MYIYRCGLNLLERNEASGEVINLTVLSGGADRVNRDRVTLSRICYLNRMAALRQL